ncbi:MAG TPA: hypothetical protein VIU15_40560, partial [Streptomyces sp.]
MTARPHASRPPRPPRPALLELLAANPAAPASVLARCVAAPDAPVLRAAGAHPAARPWLAALARREEWRIRTAVAANPACPPRLRTTLAGDPDPRVRAAVARTAPFGGPSHT